MAIKRTIGDDSWKDIATKWKISWFATAYDSHMGFECCTEIRHGTYREIVEYAEKVLKNNGYSGYLFDEIDSQ